MGLGKGGVLVSTTDGGQNYNVLSEGSYININAAFFSSENHGCVVGNRGMI